MLSSIPPDIYVQKTRHSPVVSPSLKLHFTVNPRKLPQVVASLTAEPHGQYDRLLQKKCQEKELHGTFIPWTGTNTWHHHMPILDK